MKKSNRLIGLIFILIILFIFFVFISNKPYDYKKTYNINSFNIIEEYKDKEYLFIIKHNNIKYPYLINAKYTKKRKLINDINVSENDDITCILPVSSHIDFYPLCSSDKTIVAYNNSNDDINFTYKSYNSESDNYKRIDIYTYLNNSYLLYNYKGFYLLNNTQKKDIKLFKKDIYKIELIYQKNNYLLIPDYNQIHYFNKIYCINIINGQVIELNSDNSISYNSIFINYNNNVLLKDKKEDLIYKIDIDKRLIEEVNDDYKNNVSKDNYYKIIDDKLYKEFNGFKIKISDMKISTIVNESNDFVYFISQESLFAYNEYYGLIKVMDYFEWNFNNSNMVFIY